MKEEDKHVLHSTFRLTYYSDVMAFCGFVYKGYFINATYNILHNVFDSNYGLPEEVVSEVISMVLNSVEDEEEEL